MFAADPRRAALDRVIAAGERAVAIRPDYLPALVDLGGYYIAKGDGEPGSGASAWYAKGVDVLERARDLDTRAAERFVAKMLARGARAASIPAYGNDTLYANLGLAYLRLGRLDDALAAYERCRNLDPGNPTRYVDLSAVLARLARWDAASITLLEAVTIDGGQQDAARRLVELYRRIDPGGHAVVGDDEAEARINVDDPLVRHHRCQAFAELARIHDDAKQQAAALRFHELERRFCDR